MFSPKISFLCYIQLLLSSYFCVQPSLKLYYYFFIFSKFFSLFQLSFSTINLFHYTKYFITPLTFILFSIFSTFYFSTPSTSTSFASSTFYPSTYFLYHTIWLTFTTRWILIEVSNHNLTALVETTYFINNIWTNILVY